MWKCVKLLIWMTLLWIFKKKTELPKSVLFVSKFEFEKKKKFIKMISIYTWFFTAVTFRNMTNHLVYISDISPQTIRQSTSVLPQTALMSPVCFHCVLSTAMCLRPPCPLSPTQAACVACVLDSCPRPIQSTGTRAPVCSVFHIPQPWHQPSSRKDAEMTVCGKRPPWPLQSG